MKLREDDIANTQSDMDESTVHNEADVTTSTPAEEPGNSEEKEKPISCARRLIKFYWEQEFLIMTAVAILLAKAYPPLGAVYLKPEITSSWIAVCIIFLLCGLCLKTEEFKNAFLNIYFNVTVQVFNFGVVSSLVFGVSRALVALNIISKELADGMAVCASTPMAINTVVVLTKLAGGDEAAAIFNSAAGSLIGVFLSPLLILGYLGVTGDINLVDVFYKLALRLVFPVIVGQVLRRISAVKKCVTRNQLFFKRVQLYCLVFIVYTVFCQTFLNGSGSSIGDIFLMILFQCLMLVAVMALAWYMLKFMFPDKPELRVMGLYGCSEKSVAIGVPLINAIYANNPAVGLYTLPLLIWHPMQIVVGSLVAPRLLKFVQREHERLGIVNQDVALARFEAVEGGSITVAGGPSSTEGGNAPSSE